MLLDKMAHNFLKDSKYTSFDSQGQPQIKWRWFIIVALWFFCYATVLIMDFGLTRKPAMFDILKLF